MRTVLCPYCENAAACVTGDKVYANRTDLHRNNFWVCEPCDARCGCHKNTTKPLGVLANQELRIARVAAHRKFDPLWRSGQMNRTAAYRWLAKELGMPRDKCHIGMFDTELCQRVVDLCRSPLPELNRPNP